MEKIKRLLIGVLALLPLGPISVAAQTRISDFQENPEKSSLDWNQIMNAKSMLFPKYSTSVHVDQAKEIFRAKSQINDQEIFEREFNKAVDFLSKKGMLIQDGKFMRSGAPSEGGIIN